MKKNKLTLAMGLLGSSLLVGCGGGDGGSSSSGSSSITPYSVTAIDGYLKDARVWLDINNNYQLDDDEPSASSGDDGIAVIDVTGITNPEQYPVVVQAIAGQTVDIGSDVDNPENNIVDTSYVMSAPAGEKEITPLSTLVQITLEQEIASNPSESVTQLKQKVISNVAEQFSLDTGEVLGDFIAGGDSDVAYAAENLVRSKVLPPEPADMALIIEEVKADDPDVSSNNDSSFFAGTDAASKRIRARIDSVREQAIADGGTAEEATFFDVEDVFSDQETASDSDGDGVPDFLDEFPDDETEWVNSDSEHPTNSDNIGDNVDDDDDGDGVLDTEDAFPLNPNESMDTDGDFIGNNRDRDDDNDGVADVVDDLPLDATESVDTDGDGIGNNADTDDDGDGVFDDADAFPEDPSESVDTDGDLYGDNSDWDDDNDGVQDELDAFPKDESESKDTDNDKIGNNADLDDDNDGVLDVNDAFPTDSSESKDYDGDGYGDNNDPDDDNDDNDDNDDMWDLYDAFPFDPKEWLDTDDDGIGNNADTDDDNDGTLDTDDELPLDNSARLSMDNYFDPPTDINFDPPPA